MHPHMIYSYEQARTANLRRFKTSLLLASNQAPLESFMWCLLSYLVRSKPGDFLDRIFVALNGEYLPRRIPKFDFVNELREIDQDFPITLITVDTLKAHAACIDMMMPLVHTDSFVLTHDDVILLRRGWEGDVKMHIYDEAVGAAYVPPLLTCRTHESKGTIRVAHPHSFFIAVRTADYLRLGREWGGCCFEAKASSAAAIASLRVG